MRGETEGGEDGRREREVNNSSTQASVAHSQQYTGAVGRDSHGSLPRASPSSKEHILAFQNQRNSLLLEELE